MLDIDIDITSRHWCRR